MAQLQIQRISEKRPAAAPPRLNKSVLRCRKRFQRFYPRGFVDADYVALERDYKCSAHLRWEEQLDPATFRALLRDGDYEEIAARAIRIEGRTNLIFSFEKMALRDAVRTPAGAQAFATGLFDLLHGSASLERRFTRWCAVVEKLPRKQTRVLTWPLVTVFGFIAQPDAHLYLKPTVTRRAAAAYGFDFRYASRPNWASYTSLLEFANVISRDTRDWRPRDMIDIQSFIWVQGSDEYS